MQVERRWWEQEGIKTEGVRAAEIATKVALDEESEAEAEAED